MTMPPIDPSTPEWGDVAAFVAVIRHALGPHASENHGPSGGYVWTWSHKGLWTLAAGDVLANGPVLEGPRAMLQLAGTNDWHARLALIILSAIDGLPDGVEPPRIVQASAGPAVGRVYGGEIRPSDGPVPAPAPSSPRPRYREPGGNTGVRPQNAFRSTRFPDDEIQPAGMGPGAGYAPQRVDPGPAPARPECAATAGSDLPSRHAGMPTGIDDTGRDASCTTGE